MAGSTKRLVSPRVEAVRQQVQRWRQAGGPRRPLPEDVWSTAAAIAAVDGVGAVSRIARLDYYALRRRVEKLKDGKKNPRDAFVEVNATSADVPSAGSGECVLEMERADGARMRLRLPHVAHAADLVALFLRGQS